MSDDEVERLRENLARNVGDDVLREELIRWIESRVRRETDLAAAGPAEDVLCAEAQALPPSFTCIPESDIGTYDGKLAPFLGALTCADAAVARGIALRVAPDPVEFPSAADVHLFSNPRSMPVGREWDRPFLPALAELLLDPDCAGGSELAEDVRTRLRSLTGAGETGALPTSPPLPGIGAVASPEP